MKVTHIILSVIIINQLITPVSAAKKKSIPIEAVDRYTPRTFTIVMNENQQFSQKQLDDHFTLYRGYVNKRNEIDEKLLSTPRTNQNITYSPFRGLKTSETFARNGMLLHELYFENIKTGTIIGKKTHEVLIQNFGSLEAFKEDLMASAKCARGWALTCYNLDDGRIQNYVLDSHNDKVPILTIPLLVLDTYEHAYMIDFGINRAQYLDILWDNINWDIVEARIVQWMGE
jgi:Fe-Mn family superoxide dismutase